MQNRFLSRGKRIDNGEWVEGYLYGIWERRYILWGMTNDIPNMVEVDPETVCQCTAMPDKNNKLIFENDIAIKHNNDAAWELAQCGCAMYGFFDVDFGEIEVIGNAIDNPELLEV